MVDKIDQVSIFLAIGRRNGSLEVGTDDCTDPVSRCVLPAIFLGLAILGLFAFGTSDAGWPLSVRELDAGAGLCCQRFNRIVRLIAETLVQIVL